MRKKSLDPSPSSQNPKKSHKKSKKSETSEHSKSHMDLKLSPIPTSSPAAPKSPKPVTANPTSSKLATPAKNAGIVDEDSIFILEKVIEFMSGNGGKTPTEITIKPLFESINDLLNKKINTGYKLYNRIRTLRKKYDRLIGNKVDIDNPALSTFFDLGAKIWGQTRNKGKKRAKLEEDGISVDIKTKKLKVEKSDDEDSECNNSDGAKYSDMFPIMFEKIRGFWTEEGYSMEDLVKGFESIEKSKCEKIEKKWHELIVKDMELKANKLKTDIEIITMVSKMI